MNWPSELTTLQMSTAGLNITSIPWPPVYVAPVLVLLVNYREVFHIYVLMVNISKLIMPDTHSKWDIVMEVWWLRRTGKVHTIRCNIEAEPETEEALADENLDLLIMIQILIVIFNCCIVNKYKSKLLFGLSLWIMCGYIRKRKHNYCLQSIFFILRML